MRVLFAAAAAAALAGCGGGGGDTPVNDFAVAAAYDSMQRFIGSYTVRATGPGGTAAATLTTRTGPSGTFGGQPAVGTERTLAISATTNGGVSGETRWFSTSGAFLGWSDSEANTFLAAAGPLPPSATRGASGSIGTTRSVALGPVGQVTAIGALRWELRAGTNDQNAWFCEIYDQSTPQSVYVGSLGYCSLIDAAGAIYQRTIEVTQAGVGRIVFTQ